MSKKRGRSEILLPSADDIVSSSSSSRQRPKEKKQRQQEVAAGGRGPPEQRPGFGLGGSSLPADRAIPPFPRAAAAEGKRAGGAQRPQVPDAVLPIVLLYKEQGSALETYALLLGAFASPEEYFTAEVFDANSGTIRILRNDRKVKEESTQYLYREAVPGEANAQLKFGNKPVSQMLLKNPASLPAANAAVYRKLLTLAYNDQGAAEVGREAELTPPAPMPIATEPSVIVTSEDAQHYKGIIEQELGSLLWYKSIGSE